MLGWQLRTLMYSIVWSDYDYDCVRLQSKFEMFPTLNLP